MLSFETIENNQAVNYHEFKPALIVITKVEDVDNLHNKLQGAFHGEDRLRRLDYNHFFALLVLHGLVGSSGYNITVHSISRQDERVNVRAEFVRPKPNTLLLQGDASPFHLVVIPKADLAGHTIRFVLLNDDKSVAETTHAVP